MWLSVATKLLILVTEGDAGMKDIKSGKHKVQEQSGAQFCGNDREASRGQALAWTKQEFLTQRTTQFAWAGTPVLANLVARWVRLSK